MPVPSPRQIHLQSPAQFFLLYRARFAIIIQYMVRAIVGPEMIFDGGIGMRNRNFIERRIAASYLVAQNSNSRFIILSMITR